MGEPSKAVHYRNKADECRILAEDFKNAEHREALFRIAAQYDKLAELEETTPPSDLTAKVC